MSPTILIVDDEQNILTALSRMLRVEGYAAEVAGSAEIGLEKLGSLSIDLVMLDMMMPGGMDGLECLRTIRERYPTLPVLMMSGASTIETAVEAIRLGAQNFLEKPLSNEKILIEISNCLKISSLLLENQRLRERLTGRHALIGDSSAMKAVYDRVQKAAPTVSSVLITGESGTGKELVARAIHQQSQRVEAPFIKLNCAAIPGDLIESELFGHEKGAFTGATGRKKGKFELANGGTFFLDEIGDMRLDVQAKLLRVLQEGEIERVGGVEEIQVDVRIIAATHQDLNAAIKEGRFREDLYYRINVIPIEVPPLRNHLEDVPFLVEHFAEQVAEQNGQRKKIFSEEAIACLQGYGFPGNIRELRNLVERLVILSGSDEIDVAEVRSTVLGSVAARPGGYRRGAAFKDLVDEAKREILSAALADHGENITRTANSLQVERSNLYKVLRSLGLRKAGSEGGPDGRGETL